MQTGPCSGCVCHGKCRTVKSLLPGVSIVALCRERKGEERCFVYTETWVFKASSFLYINYAAITDLMFSVKGKSTFSACSELFDSSYSLVDDIFMFFKLFSLKLKILINECG